jgi:hypothetical protein
MNIHALRDMGLPPFLDQYFHDPRHLWYRPDMTYILKPMVEWAREMLDSPQLSAVMEPQESAALEKFLRIHHF